jgi:hypothetical protein
MSDKEHACELIDQLPPSQLSAVVGLFGAMLDPVANPIKGSRSGGEYADTDRSSSTNTGRLAARGVCIFWHRSGNGESRDPEQRGGWDAAVASGRSGGNHVDQPAGGRSAGGGCVRNCGGSELCTWYGFHQGDTCDSVDDDGVRRGSQCWGLRQTRLGRGQARNGLRNCSKNSADQPSANSRSQSS